MSALPGVNVGPLDPEATAQFGQVAGQASARTLVRLHSQMYPLELRRALARKLQEGHTKAVSEDLDAVTEHVRGRQRENGDPILPEGATVRGAAVRGDSARGMLLTVTFELPSGRVGKWFVPYTPEALPDLFEVGQHYTRVHQMREQGLVAFDQEATGQEIYRRQLAQRDQELRRLREQLEGPGAEPAGDADVRRSDVLVEENEELRRTLGEMRERLAQLEALTGAGGGSVPAGGLEADIAASSGGPGPVQSSQEPAVSQEPPFEGFDELKADEMCRKLRAPETTDEERRAILSYERAHANRRTVVAAAEQELDRPFGE